MADLREYFKDTAFDGDEVTSSVTFTEFGDKWCWRVTMFADGHFDAIREEAPLLRGDTRNPDGSVNRGTA